MKDPHGTQHAKGTCDAGIQMEATGHDDDQAQNDISLFTFGEVS